jgi:hypothetical protein
MTNKQTKNLLQGAAVIAALLSAATSQAQLTGEVWENDPTSGNAATVPANTLPHANFTSSAVNYQTSSSPTTPIQTFLNNPTFSNEQNGFNPADQTDNIFIQLTGQIQLNAGANSFVVAHDDGVVLSITGITSPANPVVNLPGPTGEDFTPFTVTAPSAGSYSVVLDYNECCGGPADLVWDVNSSPITVGTGTGTVPDAGTTLGLLGLGLTGLAAFARKFRK